jgi:hypothetical protein
MNRWKRTPEVDAVMGAGQQSHPLMPNKKNLLRIDYNKL